ncbi:MAG TPA: hypothetical protein VN922_13635, partial [Bacteroidia bacterium]|nr:hypothetical protein [Bacteroidia bacterium]
MSLDLQQVAQQLPTGMVAPGNLSASTGSALVGFIQNGTGAVGRTVQSKLQDQNFSIVDFGAIPNGTAYSTTGGTDNSAAINAAIVAANALATGTVSTNGLGVATVYIPDGTWNIANSITQLPGVSLRFSKNAMLNVTATMSWAITTPLNNLCEDIGITGGRILCNHLCDGVYLQTIRHYCIDDTMIEDWNFAGWTFGNPSSTTNCYGVSGTPKTHRRFSAPPAGSVALWVRASTDSQIHDVELVGGQTGVICQSGGSFMNIHPWARVGPMLVGFNFSGGGAMLTNCYADSANQIGFTMTGTNYTITSPLVFNGTSSTSAPDNTMIAIQFNTVNPQSTVTGLIANGLASSNRIAQDIKTADSTFTGLTVLGTTTNNVVT